MLRKNNQIDCEKLVMKTRESHVDIVLIWLDLESQTKSNTRYIICPPLYRVGGGEGGLNMGSHVSLS